MKTAADIKREWIMDILEPYAKNGNMDITFKTMIELIRTKIIPNYINQQTDKEPKTLFHSDCIGCYYFNDYKNRNNLPI